MSIYWWTYDALHSNPELVASETGYVISIPSSMLIGSNENPKNPNKHNGKATRTGSFSIVATCKWV